MGKIHDKTGMNREQIIAHLILHGWKATVDTRRVQWIYNNLLGRRLT